MNKLALASIVAALAGLTAVPQPAKAGNEAAAAIGGFIGGILVGSSVRNSCPPPHYDHRGPRGPRVIIETGSRCSGHWDWVEVNVWVPGRHAVSYDDCGRRVRRWIPGRHECRRERVWIDARHCSSHRHGGYSYRR